MRQQGMEPNTITYNAALSVCDKSTLPERAFELFQAM